MKGLKFEKEIGETGAKASGSLGVEGTMIKAEVSIQYPVEKVLSPALKVIDELVDKLEKAIPGDWDKPLAEKVKQEAREELIKLLQTEQA